MAWEGESGVKVTYLDLKKKKNHFAKHVFPLSVQSKKRKCNPYGLDSFMLNYEELQDIF